MKLTAVLALAVLAVADVALAYPSHAAAFLAGRNPFVAPAATDSRGPCPMLNTLANHGYINHSGRNITSDEIKSALVSVLNLDGTFSGSVASQAVNALGVVGANGVRQLTLFDLSKHNVIEHDVSLSREDYNLGQKDNNNASPRLLEQLFAASTDGEFLTIEDLAKYQSSRVADSKATDIDFKYGSQESSTALLEASLILDVMGNQFEDIRKGPLGIKVTYHKTPVTFLKSFFGEQRFPDEWETPVKTVTSVNLLTTSNRIRDLQ